MASSTNPLVSDRHLDFLLYEVLDAEGLVGLPYFDGHSRETFDAYVGVCRRLAREVVFPSYRAVDQEPPRLEEGRVVVHPRIRVIWPRLVELGVIAASAPLEVGGQQLPLTVATAAHLYVMAGLTSAYSYAGLTTGAAHLVEAFGSEELKERYLSPLYEGRWAGTMALTEPDAGSSLSDVATRAMPAPSGGHFLVSGAKTFISAGDHDLTENIVHMVLARIDGAPAGIKGVSLFLVPKMRPEGDGLVPNDVRAAGLIHKIGWRGLPSVVLSFGEAGECHGWLVGEPNQGISYMFQMMNEARIVVGADGVATASVAYHESLAYARERLQGRTATSKDPRQPQVPIIEHPDVRRMLLRQKAIVEGGLALILKVARLCDLAGHAVAPEERRRAGLLLDLLTPVAKSFPAEKGFESNALAVQVHGGYGYSSEYLPEAWLRDQKLNSIHEGTTGIQGMDLLGRKVLAGKGAALAALLEEVAGTCRRADEAGVPAEWTRAVEGAAKEVALLTRELAGRGGSGDVEGMLRHSADYLELFSTFVVSWLWLEQATIASTATAATAAAAAAAAAAGDGAGSGSRGFYEGVRSAARYWIRTELPKVAPLVALCRENEESYAAMQPDWW